MAPPSAIYTGELRHRRFVPVSHAFRYRLCMLLLDVERIPELFAGSRLWSAHAPAPGWFRRADFHGDPARPLADCVRDLVHQRTGERPGGPVLLLANLRYFGVLMNPLSCYFCYDADGRTLRAVVAEVTNTPWRERHAYVLPASGGEPLRVEFDKRLHVSPFNPMDMRYRWTGRAPGERLAIHLENLQHGEKVFDATLSLRREPLDARALRRLLLRYPLMSLRVALAIHYQALRLWLKRVPIHTHPPAMTIPEEKTR
ncbi:MAG: hypothetical protein CALGDGBN_02703 [Pseudomonadales bacterium]|nr:hypothetical protein [Pseudomonadales bacterium]